MKTPKTVCAEYIYLATKCASIGASVDFKDRQTYVLLVIIQMDDEPLKNTSKHYPQIDFVKTLAIVSVILLHTLTPLLLLRGYAEFHIMEAIPVFLITSGLLWYISFRKTNASKISDLYTRSYFRKKFVRFIVPFAIIYVLDIVLILATNLSLTGDMIFRVFTLVIPTGGPGGYFTSLLIQLILVFPLVFYSFSKKPFATIVGMFLLDLCFELVGPFIPYQIYVVSVLRYFGAIALGLFIAEEFRSKEKVNLAIKRNVPLLVGIPLSALYLFMFHGGYFPVFRPEWDTQDVFSFFYPLFLIILVFSMWPLFTRGKNLVTKANLIGKASYFIFLVQILYFGFGVQQMFLFEQLPPVLMVSILIVANLCITSAMGLVFCFVDKNYYFIPRYRRWVTNGAH